MIVTASLASVPLAHAPATGSVAGAASTGSLAGVVAYNGRHGRFSAALTFDHLVGRPNGYASTRGARIAAHHLTVGAERSAAALVEDIDGRYRLYEVRVVRSGDEQPLAFEERMPTLPNGSQLDGWVYQPASDLLEVRDGVRRMFPWHS